MPSNRASKQKGISLVELMVGIAIGLFIVAAATVLTSTQLFENRRLVLEMQIQQDLRASSDIISRDIRRAGAWWTSDTSVWVSGTINHPFVSDVRGMTPNVTLVPVSEIQYKYVRADGVPRQYGFKLSGEKIRSYFPNGGGWQDLTDGNTLVVDSFSITPKFVNEPTPGGTDPQKMPCPKLCPDGSTDCWPTVLVRDFEIFISGHAKTDSTVVRSVRSTVRVRNDEPQINTADGNYCPS